MKNITVALFIDSRGGMMFNNRRQVKDAEAFADMCGRWGRAEIFITQFSSRLLEGRENVTVCDDPIAQCTEDCLCFIENPDDLKNLDRVDTFVIYNWNIPYPADKYLSLNIEELGFKRISKDKFSTVIHQKVTREVFKRT